MTEKKTVRVSCGIEGLEDNWVEYDVSEWTNAWFFREISDANTTRTLPDWLEPYAASWNITGTDGEPVHFPGRITEDSDSEDLREAWADAYKRISMEIADWLCVTAYLALSEVVSATRKRTRKRPVRGAKGRRKS